MTLLSVDLLSLFARFSSYAAPLGPQTSVLHGARRRTVPPCQPCGTCPTLSFRSVIPDTSSIRHRDTLAATLTERAADRLFDVVAEQFVRSPVDQQSDNARGPRPGPKGPQVSEILSVDSSTAQQESPRRVRPERPMYPPADRAAVEESGTVKWYNAMKGFGFIASDRGGKDIFVHASALDRAGIAGLTEGQRVAVDVIDGRKGPEAAGLRLI